MKINNILTVAGLFLNVVLIYSLYTLPSRISKEVSSPDMKVNSDTVKVKSETLQTKTEFVYFEGDIIDKPIKIKDFYLYDTKYPEAIFDGYISLSKSMNGSKYYIFRNDSISFLKNHIKGYFFIDNIATLQLDGESIQILYPICKKE